MTAAARTMAPVRRNSRHAGEREHLVWRELGKTRVEARHFLGALIRAAEQFDDETKAAGKQMGALGLTGIKVLRALAGIVCYRTGRLEPSIAWLQARTRLARGTVVRALARLRFHGFLNWLRRSEPTENEGVAGPQVRQITNAYWFGLRDQALAMVKKLLHRSPPTAPPEPPSLAPRRSSSKAASFAALQAWSTETGVPALLAETRAAREAARARSASSESSQNPAEEQE